MERERSSCLLLEDLGTSDSVLLARGEDQSAGSSSSDAGRGIFLLGFLYSEKSQKIVSEVHSVVLLFAEGKQVVTLHFDDRRSTRCAPAVVEGIYSHHIVNEPELWTKRDPFFSSQAQPIFLQARKKRTNMLPEFSWWTVHCLSGGFAVGLGAFGAHALKSRVADPYLLTVWDTATRYQFWHSILGMVAILVQNDQSKFGENKPGSYSADGTHRTAQLAFYGNLLFSGSLYGLVLTGYKKLGAITPIGGLIYICAWAAMI